MENTEHYRKLCLEQQTELRRLMTSSKRYDEAMRLFFRQHAMLHSGAMAGTEDWSFEDAPFCAVDIVLPKTQPEISPEAVTCSWLTAGLALTQAYSTGFLDVLAIFKYILPSGESVSPGADQKR